MPTLPSPTFCGAAAHLKADAQRIVHMVWYAGQCSLAEFQAVLNALLPALEGIKKCGAVELSSYQQELRW